MADDKHLLGPDKPVGGHTDAELAALGEQLFDALTWPRLAADYDAAHPPARPARGAWDELIELHRPRWNNSSRLDSDFFGCLICGEDECATSRLLAALRESEES